ncbi:MAG: hypothetical protein GF372_08320 [Candidatus Marinimicrobia bacterium]|nr:hypothetical protein [Candidatus Neomarinimicrobiota bacterium]
MAIANYAYARHLFAYVTAENAKKIILHESFVQIKQAIQGNMDAGPKNYFTDVLEKIQTLYPSVDELGENIKCTGEISGEIGSFDYFYKDFCNKNELFLNPIGKNHQCEAALYDPLTINRMYVKIDERDRYLKFSNYVNHLKQEFVFSRYLLAQSFYKDPHLQLVDEGVVLIDTFDYPAFSVYLEHAKSAFRIAYSILDKVAFVVNDYLELGYKKTKIYFNILSPLKNENIIEKVQINNPYLIALMDLASDFENGFYGNLKNLRNAFEHRFQNIRIWEIEDEGAALKPDEFRGKVIEMLTIAKNAIFYLVLMIEYNEHYNKNIKENDVIPSINATVLPDIFKGY